MRVTKTCGFHSRFPSWNRRGGRDLKKMLRSLFERSGRGGRSQKRGRNAIRAIVCERPPRRFAPPLLCQEGSSRPNGFRNLDSSAFAKEGYAAHRVSYLKL